MSWIRNLMIGAWLTIFPGTTLLVTSCDTEGETTVLYGPPPVCESDAQCVEWNGEGWVCDVPSGECLAPDGDVTSEEESDGTPDGDGEPSPDGDMDQADLEDDDAFAPEYGPSPCASADDCRNYYGNPDSGKEWVCTPEDFPNDCVQIPTDGDLEGDGDNNTEMYGPLTCATADECEDYYGEPDAGKEWVCDPVQFPGTDSMYIGCGQAAIGGDGDADVDGDGEEDAEEPPDMYGPQPCVSSQDCQTWYGNPDEGKEWVCDPVTYPGGENLLIGCGQVETDGDLDGDYAPEYGPLCVTNTDCEEYFGPAGEGMEWVCTIGGDCQTYPSADGDATTDYGPLSCTSDRDCEDWYGPAEEGEKWICGYNGWCSHAPVVDGDVDCDEWAGMYGPLPCR